MCLRELYVTICKIYTNTLCPKTLLMNKEKLPQMEETPGRDTEEGIPLPGWIEKTA